MHHISLFILFLSLVLCAQVKSPPDVRKFRHEIGFEGSMRSITYVYPVDFLVGSSYSYYFPKKDSVQMKLTGGFSLTPLISKETLDDGGNYLLLYAQFGFQFELEGTKRIPTYGLRVGPTIGFQNIRGTRESFFGGIEVGFIGDIWNYRSRRGNSIGFMNPRINLIFSNTWSHLVPGFEIVLFKYGIRF